MNGEDVVRTARSFIGTAFGHQGRMPGVMLDCAGVATETARALGLETCDVCDYKRQPDGATLQALCEQHMDRVQPWRPVQPGDVLLMRLARDPQHLAIVSRVDDDGRPVAIIHAYAEVGKVVEHGLDVVWRRRVIRAYRMKGVA